MQDFTNTNSFNTLNNPLKEVLFHSVRKLRHTGLINWPKVKELVSGPRPIPWATHISSSSWIQKFRKKLSLKSIGYNRIFIWFSALYSTSLKRKCHVSLLLLLFLTTKMGFSPHQPQVKIWGSWDLLCPLWCTTFPAPPLHPHLWSSEPL